jgi:hypothetical protein
MTAAPDPYAEPERFYKYAKRRQARGLALDGRVSEARHVEMLRLRLVEGLTLREVGERVGGITGTTVQQLLSHYFGVPGIQEAKRDVESEVKVPAGFIEVLQDMVLREGNTTIVNALRKREAAEWKRLRGSEGAERRAIWWNLKRIGAFLESVGAEKDPLVGPGERRLTPEEFERYLGPLPADGEG